MTIEELNAALNISKKIYRLQCRLDDLHSTGGVGACSNNTPVQGGQSVDPGQLAVELSQEIDSLKKQLEVEQTIIRRYIEKLHLKEVEHKLMILRYVMCRDWKSMEVSLGYSRSRIFQLNSAVFEKIRPR